MTPCPVVLLNRAVATRYVQGPEAALAEIASLAGELDGYRLFHALRAGLLAGLGREQEAREANERALALAADLAGHPAAVHAGPGLGDLDGLVDGVGLQDRVPAERLLGLHERPVGDAAGPHGPGFRRRRELVPALGQLARAAAALLIPRADLRVPGLALLLGHALGSRGVQQQNDVLHVSSPGFV